LGLLVLALLASFRMHVLQHRRLAKLGDRVSHLSAGISLLTDTVEGGLRDVAQEIERLSATKTEAPKPKARAATQRRVSTAARRGRSVQDIAAKEKMSESEVRLRLQLSGAANGREKAQCHGALTRPAAAGGPT
jgi:DNA-binding NarL/FixJ family response regulator